MASPLTIQPDAAAGNDAYILSSAPTNNAGTATQNVVGDSNASASIALRSVIKFDVSAVPAGATVTAVTLSQYEYEAGRSGAAPASWAVELRRILRNWVEAQVTWNIFSTGNNWGAAGCSNDTDRVAAPSASLTMDGTAAGGFVNWSGAGLVADVQAWVDGSASNYGWLLIAPNAENLAATAFNRFYSSDYATAASRPKLVIEYTEAAAGCPKMTDHYARLRR